MADPEPAPDNHPGANWLAWSWRQAGPPQGAEHLVVNIGPSHPAMHGCFRVQAVLDGEIIQDAEAEIGYMHRNFEKHARSGDPVPQRDRETVPQRG